MTTAASAPTVLAVLQYAFLFLYSELRPHYAYWEFVIMLRKFSLLSVLFLVGLDHANPSSTSQLLQLMVMTIVVIIHLVYHTRAHPYKVELLNRLEQFALAAVAVRYCLLGCLAAVVEVGSEYSSTKQAPALMTIIFVMHVFVVGVFVLCFLRHLQLRCVTYFRGCVTCVSNWLLRLLLGKRAVLQPTVSEAAVASVTTAAVSASCGTVTDCV